MKLKVKKNLASVNLEGSVDNAIRILSEYKILHGGDAQLEMDEDYCYFNLIGIVEESDKEYEKRLKIEAKQAAIQKAQEEKKKNDEIKMYERLKKKYGAQQA